MDKPLRLEKIKKRQALLEKGVELYPHSWKKRSWTEKLSSSESLKEEIKKLKEGELSKNFFCMTGRLMRKRNMGKAAFFTLQDQAGQFQCYIRKDSFLIPPDKLEKNLGLNGWDLWKLSDIGDIFALRGWLFYTKKGEPSLKVQDLKILCKSLEPLPEKYHGLEDIELKYRFRHLDLIMNPEARKIFEIRSRIIQEIRRFMDRAGFMEVETPVLQPIYGGAVAEPFETHFRRLDRQKMYLKISPEIYLKKLLAGGFEKVYEIGKNFRNEGIDRTHNPEFTMMEYYEAYTDYKDQMKFFEKLICHVVKKIKKDFSHAAEAKNKKDFLVIEYQGRKLNFRPPWKQISLEQFEELIYLSWKEPADRLGGGFQIPFKIKAGTDTEEFWAWFDALNASEYKQFIRKLKKEDKKQNKAKETKELALQIKKLLRYVEYLDSSADLEKFKNFLQAEYVRREDLINLKNELALIAFEETAERYLWNPIFVKDFPSSLSPLTKSHREQKNLVERFEPYIAGMELGNAYTELNDPEEQRKRLESQKRWSETEKSPSQKESGPEGFKKPAEQEIDENFLHALEVGMPPAGGAGLGIERLVMILTDQKSIRDCILFPAQKKF